MSHLLNAASAIAVVTGMSAIVYVVIVPLYVRYLDWLDRRWR